MKKQNSNWITCPDCNGQGKRSRRIRKKAKLYYEKGVSQFKKSNGTGIPPTPPKGHIDPCDTCTGSGLTEATTSPIPNTELYPHVAIIGGGIGGIALAIACLHRGIPFTLYERDISFNARSQGYGLTLQQASNAIKSLGITSLEEGVVSNRHLVHTTNGTVIGEWGMRKRIDMMPTKSPKRTNAHIARQSLRLALLSQLGGQDSIAWGHQLIDFKAEDDNRINLNFSVNGAIKQATADLVVGADGIRSTIRSLVIGDTKTPLQYLGCMVILGICPLKNLKGLTHHLLDNATVFQTVNGKERMYMMPYTNDTVMWQFSFPISEAEAKALSANGAQALKEEACKRTQWHEPIPQIMEATQADQITGYPVYDRALLTSEMLQNAGSITLIGDAAHPMSPFKGQGANQAILDALALARAIKKSYHPKATLKSSNIREVVLTGFEKEMIKRTARKVKDSAAAVKYLHSDIVLQEGDAPRGRALKKN